MYIEGTDVSKFCNIALIPHYKPKSNFNLLHLIVYNLLPAHPKQYLAGDMHFHGYGI